MCACDDKLVFTLLVQAEFGRDRLVFAQLSLHVILELFELTSTFNESFPPSPSIQDAKTLLTTWRRPELAKSRSGSDCISYLPYS